MEILIAISLITNAYLLYTIHGKAFRKHISRTYRKTGLRVYDTWIYGPNPVKMEDVE